MSVREAAHFLQVSEKQVQHLGRRGEVVYVARGLLDGLSVRALHARRQGRHTRAWSPRTAWAAIALLSGRNADWLGQSQTSRLRSRLRAIDSAGLVAATRHRAVAGRFDGHEAVAARLAREPGAVGRRVLSGLVNQGPHDEPDWYVDADDVAELARVHHLRPDPRGRFVLRAVTTGGHDEGGVTLDLVLALMAEDVLPALDSAASDDPRERGVGFGVLDDALRRFGGDD